MSKLFGMPLAIILCFALGLILSLLPNLPVALAAFFLAVGLTCLTYSYLGGHLDRGGNEGKGTLGVLSFKLGGSIVTFLVSWLFLNHHLSLSDAEENRQLTLKSGRDTIQVQANARPLGLLEGEEVRDWVQDLAEVDYFHPALILARRPFCSDNPGKCVLYAGFRAAAIKADKGLTKEMDAAKAYQKLQKDIAKLAASKAKVKQAEFAEKWTFTRAGERALSSSSQND